MHKQAELCTTRLLQEQDDLEKRFQKSAEWHKAFLRSCLALWRPVLGFLRSTNIRSESLSEATAAIGGAASLDWSDKGLQERVVQRVPIFLPLVRHTAPACLLSLGSREVRREHEFGEIAFS